VTSATTQHKTKQLNSSPQHLSKQLLPTPPIKSRFSPKPSSFDQLYELKTKIGLIDMFSLSIGEGAHAIVRKCVRRIESFNGSPEMPETSNFAVKVFRTGDPEIINTIK
jgi:hypothetical protein